MNSRTSTFRYLLLAALLEISTYATGQNCSVNAGSDRSSCYAASFELEAVTGGSLALTPGYQWVQTGGPTVTINSPQSLTTTVSGIPAGGGVFTFSFSATCLDGQVSSDAITITIHPQVVADAGPASQVFCLAGGQTMTATAPAAGLTGVWQLPLGETDRLGIAGSNDPSAAVTITPNTAPQLEGVNYQWVVTDNATGCFASDVIAISVINMPSDPTAYSVAGATPTGANDYALTTNSCYTAGEGQSVSLGINPVGGYYYGGTGPANGTWTLVSKPAGAPDPTINNVYYSPYNNATGLQEGQYVFKWTLSGPPCVNVEKFVTVTVPPTTGGVTKPIGYVEPNIPVKANYLCDNSSGSTPFTYSFDLSTLIAGGSLQPNETISWIPYNNAAGGTTITGANTLQPSFSGLAGNPRSGSNETVYYQYLYTISNSVTGCSINGVFPIWVGTPSSLQVTNESANILPCGTTEFVMEYRTEGAFNDQTQNLFIRFLQTTTPAGAQPVVISAPYDVVTTGNVSTGKIRLSNLTSTGTYAFQLEYGSARYCGVNQKLLNVYASIPPVANAGSNQRLACGATGTQLVGSPPGGSPVLWSQVSGPSTAVFDDNRSQTPTLSALVPGAYVFRYSLQGSGTCLGSNASDDQVAVLVTAADDVASSTATPDQTVCAGAEVFLNGNTPAAGQTGLWTVSPAGPQLDNANNPNVRVLSGSMAPAVTYTFTWTVTGGCNSASDDVMVTTTSTAGPNQAAAGSDLCLPGGTTSFSLSGNTPDPASTGTWTTLNVAGGISFSNPSVPSPTVTVPGNGEYGFVYTIETAGCGQTTDTVRVSVAASPSAANAGSDVLVCGSAAAPFFSTDLSAAPPSVGTGTWRQVSGPAGPVIADEHDATTIVNSLVQGATYRFEWTVVSGTVCSVNNKDTMTVTVAPVPQLLVTDPAAGCQPGTVDITAAAVTLGSDAGTLSYWADAAASSPLANPSAISTPGLYYIELTSTNNCQVTQPVSVQINPLATPADIVITGNTAVPPGGSTTLTATSPTAVHPVFKWYADAALMNLLHEGAAYTTPPINTGTNYYVTVQGDNLCENMAANVQIATVTLPLKLLRFEGRAGDKDNLLEWTTAEEVNVCCFEVERSADGQAFARIGRVEASGSSLENRYRFTDQDVATDHYYRLKMMDLDGSATYSPVIRLRRNMNRAYFVVYPNPFGPFIKLEARVQEAGQVEMQLFDASGRLARKQVSTLPAGVHVLTMDQLNPLPAGQYVLKVILPDGVVTRKVTKQ